METETNEDVTKFKALFDDFNKNFDKSTETDYYLLSQKWLTEWKQKGSTEPINSDLISDESNSMEIEESKSKSTEKYSLVDYSDPNHICNTWMRKELKEDQDYIIVDQSVWKFFTIILGIKGIPIIRKAQYNDQKEKYIETKLQIIKFHYVNNYILKQMDEGREKYLIYYQMQVTKEHTLKEIKEEIISWLNQKKKSFRTKLTAESVRLWKMNPNYTGRKCFIQLKTKANDSSSYDYQLDIEAKYLGENLDNNLEDAMISSTDLLLVETAQKSKDFNFLSELIPVKGSCEGCRKFADLTVVCKCKKVRYCTKECMKKDLKYHFRQCPRAGEEENTDLLQQTSDSINGKCGLQNLGNTCFMNSGLQCLSNTKGLSEFFLTGIYKNEINETNPLGTKGSLVRRYANFILSMWNGEDDVHSPWSLKKEIGQYHSTFAGYAQQDSQELINFVLDGLHEDLNRVKDKIATEQITSDGRPDKIIAELSWKRHLQRNDSIVQDLMGGQFKSRLDCPKCKNISITFDPYLSISLPIPKARDPNNFSQIQFYFIFQQTSKKSLKLKIQFEVATGTLSDIIQVFASQIKVEPEQMEAFIIGQNEILEKFSHDTLVRKIEEQTDIHKKHLFIFEIRKEDIALEEEQRHDFYLSFSTRNSVKEEKSAYSFMRPFKLKLGMSGKEIHEKIFEYFGQLYQSIEAEEGENLIEKCQKLEEGAYNVFLCTDSETKEFPFDTKITAKDIIENEDFQHFEVCFTQNAEWLKCPQLNRHTQYAGDFSKNQKHGVSIYNCLDSFRKPEILAEDNTWYCGKCKSHVQAKKTMEIYNIPEYLILHLKRFKSSISKSMWSGRYHGSRQKDNQDIFFPITDLDMTNYVLEARDTIDMYVKHKGGSRDQKKVLKQHRLLYDLYAISNHSGGMGGGHYTAYVKNFRNNKWYSMNDSSCREASPSQLQSGRSYILFYKKKSNEKQQPSTQMDIENQ